MGSYPVQGFGDPALRKQVEDLQKELTSRDEMAKKRTIKMFIAGLIIGIVGTTASIVGVLVAKGLL